jgi:UDP-N-acetylglucosamine 2-epimerase (non-hydrolysing)
MKKTVLCVVGTRPEVIKMAPVVQALEARGLHAPVLATAQHRGMLDQMMGVFGLGATWDLDLMRDNQTLPELTARMLPLLDEVLAKAQPDAVLAQGDTTTVFCTALAAFYRNLPFGHVEAGLRSGDLRAPFPEEANRRLTSVLTRWHFAPTGRARAELLREGIADPAIQVVGNTVIDALLGMAGRDDLPWPAIRPLAEGERLVVVTLHRRENFGAPLLRILAALRDFQRAHPEARIVYPVHPNPNVTGNARKILGGLPGVDLIEPQDYPCLVGLLKQAFMVCTDSGGIQEEAPALGKPVLVFREVTERPEAVDAGGVILVGSDPAAFAREAERLWTDAEAYRSMAVPRFPYGDGKAAERIAGILERDLG